MIFLEVILPVFLITALGYILQKKFQLSIRSLSVPALYILVPALVFETFYEAELDSTYLYILVYGLLLTLFLVVVVRLVSFILNLDQTEENAFRLSTGFMNNGNFGVPIILFAFGEEALSFALAIMVLHLVYMSSIGVYFAARGKYSIKDALIDVSKMPMVLAAIAALFLQLVPGMPRLPENLYGSIELLAGAAIPSVMIVLGMQLAEIKIKKLEWTKVFSAITIRLIISPLIAVGLVTILPVSELLGQVMIVQAAMPTAAVITMYAIEYDCNPDLVSSVTFFSTLLSALTLTVVLMLI